jgi:hypothetical protein
MEFGSIVIKEYGASNKIFGLEVIWGYTFNV